MRTVTLATQTGNSCAAHCATVALAELKNDTTTYTKNYAETTLWNAVKFQATSTSSAIIQMLAQANCSDPRQVVTEVNKVAGVQAKLICDKDQKDVALTTTHANAKTGLEALFNELKGSKGTVTGKLALNSQVYYSCSYTMHTGAPPSATNNYVVDPQIGRIEGATHNILVVYDGGKSYYYNPNEGNPQWTQSDWKTITQSDSSHSYVFTGVAVSIF